MEPGISLSPVSICKNKLKELSNFFKETNSKQIEHLNELLVLLRFSINALSGLDLSTCSDEYVFLLVDQCTQETLQATNALETLFKFYCSIEENLPTTAHTSLFLQWLHAIYTLQHLFSNQNSESNKVEMDEETIELWEIRDQITQALNHINTFHHDTITPFRMTFMQAKNEANKLLLRYPNWECLQNISGIDFSCFNHMEKSLVDLKRTILEKSTLVINQQPLSVLMKLGKKPQFDVQRNPKATATNISINLIGLFGGMDNVSINIGLITENMAKEIQKCDNPFQIDIIFAGSIYSCVESTKDENPVQFLTRRLEKRGNEDGLYEVTVSNISVINLFGRDKGVRVSNEKYYFLITAEFFYENTLIKAWTMSTPVVIITYSGQMPAALATISRATHFSLNTGIPGPASVREQASVGEIRNILKLHFEEWTTLKPVDGPNELLSLDKPQLQFLADMLMDNFCRDGNCNKLSRCYSCSGGNTLIPLKSFYEENIGRHNFSFWLWFYKSVYLLKRKYIRHLWTQGCIQGFIGKIEAQQLLHNNGCRIGNFLLRFSESSEGKLCAMFVDSDQIVKVYVLKIDENSCEAVKKTFLENIYGRTAMTQERFLTLYPDILREVAFPRPHPARNPGQPQKPAGDGCIPYVPE